MPDRFLLRAGLLFLMALAPACSGSSADDPNQGDDADVRRRRCGNGVCGTSETCTSCPQDCGACMPDPPAPDPGATDAGDPPVPDAGTDPAPTPAGSGYPKTIGWFGGIGPENFMSQLDNLAYYHLGGIKYPVWYGGIPDNLTANFVTRMSSTELSAFQTETKQNMAAAAAKGLTDNFLGVYGAADPWDVYSATDIAAMKNALQKEAQFAKAAGLKGIWFDFEPYDQDYVWDQELSSAFPASQHSTAEVKKKYYDLGYTIMQAMQAGYPGIQVIVEPDAPHNDQQYLHYEDFVAGIIAAQAAATAQNGIVIADEMYGVIDPNDLKDRDDMEMGLQYPEVVGVANSLPYFDQLLGTKTWDYHVANDTIAQVLCPYGVNDGVMHQTLDDLAAALTAERANTDYVRKYTWVYDERGVFAKAPLATPVTCTFAGSTFTSNLPCGGEMLHRVLPAP